MTKEELEKEAERYINSKQKPLTKYDLVAFAEPREKQIKALGKRCLQLQADKGRLTDRCTELEAQIEKMKCCYNCKHSRTEYEHCRTEKSEKWEIKEK